MADIINSWLGSLHLPTFVWPPFGSVPTPTSSSSLVIPSSTRTAPQTTVTTSGTSTLRTSTLPSITSSTFLTITSPSPTRPSILTITTSTARPTPSAPADSRIPVPGINGTADAAKYRPICHASQGVHILAGSGAQVAMYNGYGRLVPTIDGLLQAFPGSTNFSIPFNKTSDQAYAGAAINQGVAALSANLDWYTKGCPDTPIMVIGFSLGGIVVMNTFCGLSISAQVQTDPINPSYLPNIIKVILYGEETYKPNLPFNTGTCTTGQGSVARFDSSRCYPYANKFASYCDQFDGGCCKNASEPAFPAAHLGYPQKYFNATIAQVRNAYNAYKSGTA